MSRTDASRATASGMNELGKSTVSRSGSTGRVSGIDGRSVLETSSASRRSDSALIDWLLSAGGPEASGASPAHHMRTRSSQDAKDTGRFRPGNTGYDAESETPAPRGGAKPANDSSRAG